MSRYRRRNRAVQRKNFLGMVLIACVLIVVIWLAYFRYQLQSAQVAYDTETLCPVGEKRPKYVALVFDKSDVYNKIQQQFLRRFFTQFKANLSEGTQVSVYLIGDQKNKEITADFVICAPRTGKDANAFYENPKRIQQRWKSQFEQPLDQMIEGYMQQQRADISPIMEIFQVVSLTAFSAEDEAAEKQIILISDMLQHTAEWSHYRGQLDFYELQNSTYYQRINTDLKGAEVNILYVRREGKENLQNKRHAFFWVDFIESMGGRVTLIEKIEG